MTRPFKSKFIPYVEDIKKWRRAGSTWQEVAEKLTKEKGIKADAGNVCRVMGRIKRRPYPLGAEPEPTEPKPDAMQPSAQKGDVYDEALDAHLKHKEKPKTPPFKITKPIDL